MAALRKLLAFLAGLWPFKPRGKKKRKNNDGPPDEMYPMW
jgi:hypothetical protein